MIANSCYCCVLLHLLCYPSGLQVQCPGHAAAHLSVYVRFSVVYSMNSEVGDVFSAG